MNINKTYKRLKQWIKDCLYPKKITPKMFIICDDKHKPKGKRILAEISWDGDDSYYDILHWSEFIDLKHQEGWYDSTAEYVPSTCIKSYIEF